jgi:hypothetical protein
MVGLRLTHYQMASFSKCAGGHLRVVFVQQPGFFGPDNNLLSIPLFTTQTKSQGAGGYVQVRGQVKQVRIRFAVARLATDCCGSAGNPDQRGTATP